MRYRRPLHRFRLLDRLTLQVVDNYSAISVNTWRHSESSPKWITPFYQEFVGWNHRGGSPCLPQEANKFDPISPVIHTLPVRYPAAEAVASSRRHDSVWSTQLPLDFIDPSILLLPSGGHHCMVALWRLPMALNHGAYRVVCLGLCPCTTSRLVSWCALLHHQQTGVCFCPYITSRLVS